MKILMFSKALILGAYQKKCEELAKLPDVQLRVVVPPHWDEAGRRMLLERRYIDGYELVVRKMVFNGHFHCHFYPNLQADFGQFKPQVVHLDEEAYNLATAHGLWLSKRAKAKTVFFTWQNIYRELPFPFNAIERYCLRDVDYAIAGNNDAADVLRRKGFDKSIEVIPQFGVDPELYSRKGLTPATLPGVVSETGEDKPFIIGYAGRLVPQKGLVDLLEAAAGLSGNWQLALLGDGPLRPTLDSMAQQHGVRDRVLFLPAVKSVDVPAYLAAMDVLALPSLTTPNWKEQFGRVLIEAMACEVPLVGSDSGEIPHVIGNGGLVFHEGNVTELRARLAELQSSPELRRKLATNGRQRVLDHYTQARVAEATARVYRELMEK